MKLQYSIVVNVVTHISKSKGVAEMRNKWRKWRKLELLYRMFIKLSCHIVLGLGLNTCLNGVWNYSYIYQSKEIWRLSSAEVAFVTSWGYLRHFCTHDKYWRVEHSGQTTGHSREHARVWAHPVTFPLYPTKFPWSTSATRAISVLSSIILPVQTFFSRVLLLR